MDKMIDVDEKPNMIFRNPAKEMITLSVPYNYGGGKLGVSVRYQSAAEIVDREPLDDLVIAAHAPDRVRVDDAFLDAVAAVGRDSHADPIVAGSAERPIADVIDRGRCG